MVALFVVASIACGAVAHAATITIVNNDGAGGRIQRRHGASAGRRQSRHHARRAALFIFQHAAAIWAAFSRARSRSSSARRSIRFTCDATSAVLGQAGPSTIHRDFTGAPVAGHWYHQALANKLSGYRPRARQSRHQRRVQLHAR
jgi:hypothetical protein